MPTAPRSQDMVGDGDDAGRRYGAVRSWWTGRKRRRRARLVTVRQRRALAQEMRAVCRAAARDAPDTWKVLLRARAMRYRSDLLEVAALLEQAEHPDWACVAALRELLRDGRTSPLYNPAVDPRHLGVILGRARAGLQAGRPQGARFPKLT
jgi:hypothetical protein